MKKLLLLSTVGTLFFGSAKSNIKTPIANTGQGWSVASNWGTGGVPVTNDTVLIPNGFTLNVKGNIYNAGKPRLVIYINGTLDFDPSGKLDLANFSEIHVLTGGSITTNGSSSEQILINNSIKYNGNLDGNINGPLFSNASTGVSPNGFIPLVILPVTLVQFSPQLNKNELQLNWTIVKDAGLTHYELESRRPGQQWKSLWNYILPGEPGDKIINEFKETLTTNGKYDYRLKIKNENGNGFYSKIVSVDFNKRESLLKLFPNPVITDVAVNYGRYLSEGQISLVNCSGKVVFQSLLTPGYSTNLNVSNYPKGMYTLSLNSGNERFSEMFFIR